MYLMTCHRTFVAFDQSGRLIHTSIRPDAPMPALYAVEPWNEKQILHPEMKMSGPLAGFAVSRTDDGRVRFSRNGMFLCADPAYTELSVDRSSAGPWETFALVADEDIGRTLGATNGGASRQQTSSLKRDCAPAGPILDIENRLNADSGNTSIPYKIAAFRDMSQLEVEADFKSSHSTFAQINLTLSASLLEAADKEGRPIERLRSSLLALSPHMSRFFDGEKGGARLHFDFDDRGSEGKIVFDRSKNSPSPLIPDLYMLEAGLRHQNFVQLSFRDFSVNFLNRSKAVFWRGASTGAGGTTFEEFTRNPRVVSCIRIRDLIGQLGDARISELVQYPKSLNSEMEAYLSEQGIRASARVPEQEFGDHQMFIDLPGNASAWGTYRKYLMGRLVLRPHHRSELFYYRFQEPLVHFIPLSADLSDLPQAVEWVRRNQLKAAHIAYAGRRLMMWIVANMNMFVHGTLCGAAEYTREPFRSDGS